MINSDVQLFWANDENGNIAIIFDMVEEDRNKKYTCPVCGFEVRPVAIDNKTKTGKVAQVSSHFSHFDASKCSNESAIHYWFKNKILVNGDSFIIKTDVENEYKCKELLVEQFYRTEFGIYRPDITIITECDKTIYFEMNYTNKKKIEDYMDKWLELGNPVVEVDLKALMSASLNKTKYEFKALFYEGKCFNTKKNDLYYDTIGKHKEKTFNTINIDDKMRERISKLDWFWKDVQKYKKYKLTIDYMINIIDSIDETEDKILLVDILKKLKCSDLIENYLKITKDKTSTYLRNELSFIDERITFNTSNGFTQFANIIYGTTYNLTFNNHNIKTITLKLNEQLDYDLKENIKLNVLNIINDENAEITIDNIINNIMLKFNNYNLDITKGHRNIRIKGLYKTRTIFIEIEKDKVLFNKEYWEEVKSVHWRGGKYRQYLKNEFIKKNYITFDFNDYNSVQESIENQILIEINKSKIYKA